MKAVDADFKSQAYTYKRTLEYQQRVHEFELHVLQEICLNETPYFLQDIDYLISTKSKRLDYCREHCLNTGKLEQEFAILTAFREKTKYLLTFYRQHKNEQFFLGSFEVDRLRKIVKAIEAAYKTAIMRNDQIATKLLTIIEDPDRFIQEWNTFLQFQKEGRKDIEEFEQIYNPADIEAVETHKKMCEIYGSNHDERLKVWYSQTATRLQDPNPKYNSLRIHTRTIEQYGSLSSWRKQHINCKEHHL